MDCSLPDSSVFGNLQARILEWVAIPFCRDPQFIVIHTVKNLLIFLWLNYLFKSMLLKEREIFLTLEYNL